MTYRYDDAGDRSQASELIPDAGRLLAQVRARPEAFLVIAAGIALLLRGGRRVAAERSAPYSRMASSLRASGYAAGSEAGDLADQISETASGYVSSMPRLAQEASEHVSQRSAQIAQRARAFPDELDDAVRDHPLALAAVGIAVGAAIGASLPALAIASRSRADAKGALGAVARQAERLVAKAEDARGMARDVADIGSATQAEASSGLAQRAPFSREPMNTPAGASSSTGRGAFSGGLHRSQTQGSKF